MLVLSRRINEKLVIPCIGATVQVLSIQGGQVRLGVDAPQEVAVFREEIYKGEPKMRPEAPPGRAPAMMRNRLARLALGLDRLHKQTQGRAAPALEAGLAQLGDEFAELACLVNGLLDGNEACDPKLPVGCGL